jgi:hypothetical protein
VTGNGRARGTAAGLPQPRAGHALVRRRGVQERGRSQSR